MRQTRAFVSTLGLLLLMSSTSQAETDHQAWTSAGLRYTLAPDVEISLTQHARWKKNLAQLDSIMPELEIGHPITNHLDLVGGYRYIQEHTASGDFEAAHRFHIQAKVHRDFGRITPSYRFRVQRKQEMDEEQADSTVRNRLGFTMDTDSRFTPLVAAESFIDLTEDGPQSRSFRGSIGSRIKIDKNHRLKLRYHHEIAVDGSGDVERIFVVDYQFRLKAQKESDPHN